MRRKAGLQVSNTTVIKLLLFKIRINDNETITIMSSFDSGTIVEYKIIKK